MYAELSLANFSDSKFNWDKQHHQYGRVEPISYTPSDRSASCIANNYIEGIEILQEQRAESQNESGLKENAKDKNWNQMNRVEKNNSDGGADHVILTEVTQDFVNQDKLETKLWEGVKSFHYNESLDTPESIIAAIVAGVTSDDWKKQVHSLETLQSVCLSHAHFLQFDGLRDLIHHVVDCALSLRSGVSKVALKTITCVFQVLGDCPQGANTIDIVVPVVLPKSVCEKRFVAATASDCLSLLCHSNHLTIQTRMLSCLSRFICHRHAAVASKASDLVSHVVESLINNRHLTPQIFTSTILTLVGHMLVERQPLAKQSGRRILSLSKQYFSSYIAPLHHNRSVDLGDHHGGTSEHQDDKGKLFDLLMKRYFDDECSLSQVERLALQKAIQSMSPDESFMSPSTHGTVATSSGSPQSLVSSSLHPASSQLRRAGAAACHVVHLPTQRPPVTPGTSSSAQASPAQVIVRSASSKQPSWSAPSLIHPARFQTALQQRPASHENKPVRTNEGSMQQRNYRAMGRDMVTDSTIASQCSRSYRRCLSSERIVRRFPPPLSDTNESSPPSNSLKCNPSSSTIRGRRGNECHSQTEKAMRARSGGPHQLNEPHDSRNDRQESNSRQKVNHGQGIRLVANSKGLEAAGLSAAARMGTSQHYQEPCIHGSQRHRLATPQSHRNDDGSNRGRQYPTSMPQSTSHNRGASLAMGSNTSSASVSSISSFNSTELRFPSVIKDSRASSKAVTEVNSRTEPLSCGVATNLLKRSGNEKELVTTWNKTSRLQVFSPNGSNQTNHSREPGSHQELRWTSGNQRERTPVAGISAPTPSTAVLKSPMSRGSMRKPSPGKIRNISGRPLPPKQPLPMSATPKRGPLTTPLTTPLRMVSPMVTPQRTRRSGRLALIQAKVDSGLRSGPRSAGSRGMGSRAELLEGPNTSKIPDQETFKGTATSRERPSGKMDDPDSRTNQNLSGHHHWNVNNTISGPNGGRHRDGYHASASFSKPSTTACTIDKSQEVHVEERYEELSATTIPCSGETRNPSKHNSPRTCPPSFGDGTSYIGWDPTRNQTGLFPTDRPDSRGKLGNDSTEGPATPQENNSLEGVDDHQPTMQWSATPVMGYYHQGFGYDRRHGLQSFGQWYTNK